MKISENNTITVDKTEWEELKSTVQELQEKLNNKISEPDFSRELVRITTQDASYTATEDYFICGRIKSNDGYAGQFCINEMPRGEALVSSPSWESGTVVNVFGKAGDVITTRANYGVYDLIVYGLK